mmetsp:Transcript_4361/g.17144  ORF Transcript_4361/g.17144 Transcript_4361/m.17144 type:complete len:244 (-) Transcript_4361:1589-2320(-)
MWLAGLLLSLMTSPKRRRLAKVNLADKVDAVPGPRLAREFYERADAVEVARDLLGKALCVRTDGATCRALVVETEAYTGLDDRACHSANFGRTKRTESLYRPGGHAYVYTCRGTNHLFNVVIGDEELPAAVLVRAVEPLENVEVMLARRNLERVISARLAAGPGMLTRALGIDRTFDRLDLCMEVESEELSELDAIWIEDVGVSLREEAVLRSPRVNVDYAGEDKDLPYRFRVRDSPWTSRAK